MSFAFVFTKVFTFIPKEFILSLYHSVIESLLSLLSNDKELEDEEMIWELGYLKSEILYRSKIRPDRVLSSISDDEINTLYNVTLQTIKEAYLAGGLTIKSFWSPDGQRGMFPVHVYKKEIDPLGNSIVAEKFKDGRTSYWVPKIQL